MTFEEIRSARNYHKSKEWEDGPKDWAIDELIDIIENQLKSQLWIQFQKTGVSREVFEVLYRKTLSGL